VSLYAPLESAESLMLFYIPRHIHSPSRNSNLALIQGKWKRLLTAG
jgi:hypothetical protein